MINNLKVMQNMPLSMKIILTKKRIEEFANEVGWEKVFVSFSGGKDSTVLLDIARQLFNFPAVFIDTGLEYPEIKDFVKTLDEITTIRPKMSFVEVLKKYGFPLISKEQAQYIRQYRTCKSEKTKHTRIHGNKWGRGKISKKWLFLLDAPFKISEQCCDVMKKRPIHKYIKENKQHAIVGTMAEESNLRVQSYKRFGCNMFTSKQKQCRPLMFWTESDIWEYIKLNNIPYCSLYDNGVKRTGCIFCMFGVHLEKGENRFEKLSKSHPQLWDYCMYKLGLKKVLEYINVKTGEKT